METTLQLATNQGVVLPPRSAASKNVLAGVRAALTLYLNDDDVGAILGRKWVLRETELCGWDARGVWGNRCAGVGAILDSSRAEEGRLAWALAQADGPPNRPNRCNTRLKPNLLPPDLPQGPEPGGRAAGDARGHQNQRPLQDGPLHQRARGLHQRHLRWVALACVAALGWVTDVVRLFGRVVHGALWEGHGVRILA